MGTTGDREAFLKYSAAIHYLTHLGEEKEKAKQHASMLDGVLYNGIPKILALLSCCSRAGAHYGISFVEQRYNS